MSATSSRAGSAYAPTSASVSETVSSDSTPAFADGSADDGGGQNCVDNGITYHSGDVVLRPGCQQSCVCTDGTVGDCSGIPCPVDGSIIIDPAPVATITMGGAISPGIEVSVDGSRGSLNVRSRTQA